jgi:hypothetical protein
MTKLDSAKIPNSERAHLAEHAPSMISPMTLLCKLLMWSFLCCLPATRVQAQGTERGGGI